MQRFSILSSVHIVSGKRFVAIGFLGSIIWIAIYSYLMVWWADLTGKTFGISNEVSFSLYFDHLHPYLDCDLIGAIVCLMEGNKSLQYKIQWSLCLWAKFLYQIATERLSCGTYFELLCAVFHIYPLGL